MGKRTTYKCRLKGIKGKANKVWTNIDAVHPCNSPEAAVEIFADEYGIDADVEVEVSGFGTFTVWVHWEPIFHVKRTVK